MTQRRCIDQLSHRVVAAGHADIRKPFERDAADQACLPILGGSRHLGVGPLGFERSADGRGSSRHPRQVGDWLGLLAPGIREAERNTSLNTSLVCAPGDSPCARIARTTVSGLRSASRGKGG